MKIRIVKASEPTYWYEDAIGKIYTVLSTDEVERKYKVDGGWYVDFEDCEEVIEHNSQLYRKVDRPVREGDTVLITEFDGNIINEVRRVKKLYYFSGRNDGSLWIDEKIYDEDFLDTHSDKYVIIEAIEQPEIGPSYAEVSELIHEATAEFNEGVDELTGKYDSTLRNLSDDIVTHNGKQYRKVKRKAAVGELVYTVEYVGEDAKVGDIQTVEEAEYADGSIQTEEGAFFDTETRDEYFVLEPIETTPTLTETDLIANLAQEVASLKKDLHHAQSDIVDLEDRLDENEKDTEELIGRMNDLGGGAEVAMVKRFEEVAGKLATLKAEHIQKSIMHVDPELVTYLNTKAEAYDIALLLVKEALRNG